MQESLTILLMARAHDRLVEEIVRLAPSARLLHAADVRNYPALLEQVDISYGTPPPEWIEAAPRLRWIQTTGAGVGWVQRPGVREHPVVVTNAPIHAVPISEHLFGMLLMLVRRLDECLRLQLVHQWKSPPQTMRIDRLEGMTLCVLGPGVIGRRCCALGAAHGMQVTAVSRSGKPVEHAERVYRVEELDAALARADVVMNLLPGTSQTHRLLDARRLGLLPEGAILCNAGRGSTVDTAALVDALAAGRLGGACLDVVDPEPLPEDHALWDMPHVLISPHCSGGGIRDYHQLTAGLFLQNLRRFLAGKPLDRAVDKTAGY